MAAVSRVAGLLHRRNCPPDQPFPPPSLRPSADRAAAWSQANAGPTRGSTAAILAVTSGDITPGRLGAGGTTHQSQTWKPNHDHDPRQP